MSAMGYNEAKAILSGLREDGVITGHRNLTFAEFGDRLGASSVTVYAPPTADVLDVEAAVKAALGPPWQVRVEFGEAV